MLSENGIRFSATSSFATGSASLTVAGVAGSRHFITDLSVTSDRGTAIIQVKDSATVVWQNRVANTLSQQFRTPIEISTGSAIVAVVDGGGTAYINVQGFTL